MFNEMTDDQMKDKTRQLRINILKMLCEAGSGHSGGSLSSIDILAVLYNKIMKHDPKNPSWDERDRFVLSKGHVCPAVYAVLADCGYFPEKELMTLRKFGSILQGHPYMFKTPGFDVSSGSLGQGLSIATGMAIATKMNKAGNRIFCLMGDGENQEGQIWEAAMSAAHHKLDNLCGIIDKNRLQIDGNVIDVMDIDPLSDKWKAFNWNVIEVDGHDTKEIENAFKAAGAFKGKPTVIIACTIKGRGVSFMENISGWHGMVPNKELLASALAELEN